MKGFVVSVVVLLGLAATADLVARGIAERRIAERAASSLDLDDEPDVTIGGWPFVLAVLNGTIPEIEVESAHVTRRDVSLDKVSLRLLDVEFDVASLGADGGRVKIGGGEGEATMTDDSLTSLLQSEGAPVEVRFEGSRVLVRAEGVPGEARGDVSLDGGDLVVSGEGLPATYSVSLPRLGRRIDYSSLTIVGGRARLILDIEAGALSL